MQNLTWTEAHQREAFVRLCELASEIRQVRDDSCPYNLAHAASSKAGSAERWFRIALGNAFDADRIDAEVAIVRQRATRSDG